MDPQTLEKRKKELLKAKVKRLVNSKLDYYTPIGVGEEFINKFASGKYSIGAFIAANGVGKTLLECMILAQVCFPSENKFFQHDFFQKFPYLKKLRVVSDPTTVKEAIIPTLKDWLPKGRYKTFNMGKSYEYKWVTDTGFEFDLMTFEQDIKEFESANLGMVLLDEPPPEPIYKACVSRLRRGGVMGIFCTPLTGSAWLYDEFAANPDLEKQYKFIVTAEVEDACSGYDLDEKGNKVYHGVRGFLNHDDILRMIAQYDTDDMQARIFGKFQHLTGLVFKNWNKSVHVIKPFHINKRDFIVLDSLDTHLRNKDAYVQVAMDKYGTYYVIDELFANNTTEELAERIKTKQEGLRLVKNLIEPAAFNEDQHEENKTENSLAKKLAKYGLRFVPGSKRRADATKAIKDALSYQATRGHMVRPPQLYVFDTCVNLIYEIEHWQYDEYSGKTQDKKNLSEKPQDKNDHLIECLGRILLEEPDFEYYHIEEEQKSYQSNRNLDPYGEQR